MQERKEPDRQSLLGQDFAENGWGGLMEETEIADDKQEQLQSDFKEIAQAYAGVLDADEGSPGAVMFEDLLDRTLRQPTYGHNNNTLIGFDTDQIDDPDVLARIRHGQNQVVKHMLAMVNYYRQQGEN